MSTSYHPSNPAGYPGASYPKASHKPNIIESLCLGLSETRTQEKPHGIKVRYLMNFYKASTALLILSMMNHYKNYTLGSFLCLALHGIYGMLWFFKDLSFTDKNFDKRVGFFGAIVHLIVLSGYWVLPWIQISGHGINHPSSERVMACIMLFTGGMALMLTSDAQKTFTLQQRQGLIRDGMFKYTRNPNYLGEMMVQAAFAFATGSIIAWGIIISFWVLFFIPRMVAKDVSLRNKEGAAEYFAHTSILLPKFFFKNTLLHYLSWIAIFAAIFWVGQAISWIHFFKKINPIKFILHALK